MPHNELKARINDPSQWLEGGVPNLPRGAITGLLGVLKRFQPVTKTPQASQLLGSAKLGSAADINTDMMNRMYKEANPVFRKMQAQGMFDRFQPAAARGLPPSASASAKTQETMDSMFPTPRVSEAWEGLRQLRSYFGG